MGNILGPGLSGEPQPCLYGTGHLTPLDCTESQKAELSESLAGGSGFGEALRDL